MAEMSLLDNNAGAMVSCARITTQICLHLDCNGFSVAKRGETLVNTTQICVHLDRHGFLLAKRAETL